MVRVINSTLTEGTDYIQGRGYWDKDNSIYIPKNNLTDPYNLLLTHCANTHRPPILSTNKIINKFFNRVILGGAA